MISPEDVSRCESERSGWSGFTEVRSTSTWACEIPAMGANRYTKHIDEPAQDVPTPWCQVYARCHVKCTPPASGRSIQMPYVFQVEWRPHSL